MEEYLPAGQDWYDFGSETRHVGGRTIVVGAPLDRMLVFARADAILPVTPGIDGASARSEAIELRVYAGRDDHFARADDSGDGASYRRGAATGPLRWQAAERRPVVGRRAGSYPGIAARLRFKVRLIDGRASHTIRTIESDGTEQMAAL